MGYKLATTRGPAAPRQASSARRRRRVRRPGPGPRPGPVILLLVVAAAVQQWVVLVREHGPKLGQVALQEHALRKRPLAARGFVRQPISFDARPGVAFHQKHRVRRHLVAGRHLCGIKFRAPYAIDATSSPSLRLLDGVEVHEVHNQTHWLISTQAVTTCSLSSSPMDASKASQSTWLSSAAKVPGPT